VSNDVIKADKLNYILVEGPDDAQVLYHLLRYYGLDTYITIQQKEGIDNLLEALEVELKRPAARYCTIVLTKTIRIHRPEFISHLCTVGEKRESTRIRTHASDVGCQDD